MQRPRMTKPNDIPKLLTIADLSVRWDMPRQSLHDKKGENKFPLQCNMSRTIGRHSSSKATSSNTRKRIRTSRQEHNGKHDGISSSSCIWTRTTNKKVAHFVPLSCFHWHISCHFWTFDDITETPGSAWAITKSDSSFPLCSFLLLLLRFYFELSKQLILSVKI
ncbi:Uncharacterised protein [Exiguobacterium aurantiacum]|uniref:Uncharacterized protein n=1 Tax=Exiguobacterium aurantiacum TaxID=33987 RepID=A0A377HHB6_9BACL|nr:Uncharacterised protein [Exiguobacterium aurantiacum]